MFGSRSLFSVLVAGVAVAFGCQTLEVGDPETIPIDQDASTDALTQLALDPDEAIADQAITQLRALGPAGLLSLLDAYPETLASLREGTRSEAGERLRRAIDVVSGQRDGHASGLYWYTDLARAMAAARALGRPVVSLRLLGRLDEEYSCANSRFFRLVLYADERVASFLRENVVLHWSSERPAPRITIDMGDGRELVRTITGNSAHYVMASRLGANGRVVDVVPGLSDPNSFVRDLREAIRHLGDEIPALTQWHRVNAAPLSGSGPDIASAMRVTTGKMIVEMPLAAAMMRQGNQGNRAPAPTAGRASFSLSAGSRALLRVKLGRPATAEELRALERSTTRDTALSTRLHREIHGIMSRSPNASFESLNARIYEDVFLTPRSDAWLGLRGGDMIDALDAIAE